MCSRGGEGKFKKACAYMPSIQSILPDPNDYIIIITPHVGSLEGFFVQRPSVLFFLYIPAVSPNFGERCIGVFPKAPPCRQAPFRLLQPPLLFPPDKTPRDPPSQYPSPSLFLSFSVLTNGIPSYVRRRNASLSLSLFCLRSSLCMCAVMSSLSLIPLSTDDLHDDSFRDLRTE
ncbi:hypothetical protein BCR43DRAFT_494158 [Syncephalastrum racemosum]|uniref:Uncharacterized protein n=1 Tax=Syncephalastrum racemosum TaxID=13706 RepID=A0A1X2H7I2_SYNRA|nr:hypothetical protein BCR43DRAFT_494158 [Syncephalastrum racemosum]